MIRAQRLLPCANAVLKMPCSSALNTYGAFSSASIGTGFYRRAARRVIRFPHWWICFGAEHPVLRRVRFGCSTAIETEGFQPTGGRASGLTGGNVPYPPDPDVPPRSVLRLHAVANGNNGTPNAPPRNFLAVNHAATARQLTIKQPAGGPRDAGRCGPSPAPTEHRPPDLHTV